MERHSAQVTNFRIDLVMGLSYCAVIGRNYILADDAVFFLVAPCLSLFRAVAGMMYMDVSYRFIEGTKRILSTHAFEHALGSHEMCRHGAHLNLIENLTERKPLMCQAFEVHEGWIGFGQVLILMCIGFEFLLFAWFLMGI